MAVKIQGTTIINDRTAYVDLNGTSAAKFPVGTDGQRPTGVTGQIRYNTTSSYFEGYYGSTWCPLGSIVSNDYCQSLLTRQIWGWGDNLCGQAGWGTTVASLSPVREFCSATDWCKVTISNRTTHAIKTSGEIWGWGRGANGTLGTGTVTDTFSPVREICSATDWCELSKDKNGGYHSLAIKTDGSLWSWGIGTCYRLGTGSLTNVCSPVRERCSDTTWCQASAGEQFSLAIKTNGQVWVWGDNNCGQLGDGTTVTKQSPVRERSSSTDWCLVNAHGGRTSIGVKTTGQIWTWGSGYLFKLGTGTTVARCSPVRERCSATDWCAAAGGGFPHMVAIKTNGRIWSWGGGARGALGDGTAANKCSPVREFTSSTNWCSIDAGFYHTMAMKTDGSLWGWGDGACGRIGNNSTSQVCSPVREICSATDWCQVSAGKIASTGIRLTL